MAVLQSSREKLDEMVVKCKLSKKLGGMVDEHNTGHENEKERKMNVIKDSMKKSVVFEDIVKIGECKKKAQKEEDKKFVRQELD